MKPDVNEYFVNSVKDIHCNMSNNNQDAVYLCNSFPKPDTIFKWKNDSCDDVLSIVESLKNDKTKDIYDINGFLIKQVINYIISPLTFCIN